MNRRWSLGPVFVYDMLALARRWQVYASRAAFVLFLLIGMLVAWYSYAQGFGGLPTLQQLAVIGRVFFYALAGVQLSFLLLAAPAAAAGSICIDRARGTLLHMMVTDLSDAEIVLGRLGSRLMPVFGLVACAVPVACLAGLLGGIEFGALLGLFVVSIALAILGCSLALAISVKASKTHEVLMAVYLAFGVWLLSVPIWQGMAFGSKVLAMPPDWFVKTNPFVLVYSPYMKPGFARPLDFAIYVVGTLVISVLLVAWSIWRLRRAVVESTGRTERASRRSGWMAWLFPSIPGPTLDGNPVLWREWHRNRPSRLARWLWRGLLTVSWGFVAWGLYEMIVDGADINGSMLQLGYIILVFFGLLLVATSSATVLAEERTRGSLDILLSTPLSTRSIVMAKWWGAYRTVLGLAIMPFFVAVFLAAASPDVPVIASTVKWGRDLAPLTSTDRILAVVWIMADFLASGALIVTIGLFLATWISRVGRAVGASVVIFVVLGIGWPFASQLLMFPLGMDSSMRQALPCLSPPFGTMTSLQMLTGITFDPRGEIWLYLGIVILIKLAGAGFLLGLTLWTFNRCLERVDDRRPANFQPPVGPPSRRSSRRIPARPTTPIEQESLASVIDSPSPLP
jgi:ABC-type transport system involved in multi-copper enzyme maturation permease subunit